LGELISGTDYTIKSDWQFLSMYYSANVGWSFTEVYRLDYVKVATLTTLQKTLNECAARNTDDANGWRRTNLQRTMRDFCGEPIKYTKREQTPI
jgi:hypothetical protein